MENNEIPSTTPVPSVLKTLGNGCNLVANNFKLMVLPIILDLFLLFGPRLRIAEYFQPMFAEAYKQMLSTITESAAAQLEIGFQLITAYLNSINLFSAIQTFPIGVGLLDASGSSVSPLGTAVSIQMKSFLQIIPALFFLLILGVLLGVFFFSINAKAAGQTDEKSGAAGFRKQLLNTVLFYLALIILLVILALPVSCVTTVTFMASPILYQIFIIAIIALGCWLVIPLYYIPHGIFVKNLEITQAIRESINLSFWSGPVTIRFILFSVVISMGLNMIWTIPAQNSWLILFSIFGHAFITTSLLSASFMLYKELTQWQEENMEFLNWRKANLRINKLFKKESEQHD